MMSNIAVSEFVKLDTLAVFPREPSGSVENYRAELSPSYPENHATLWENDVNIKTFVLFMSQENQIYFSRKNFNDKIKANLHRMAKNCQVFQKFCDNIKWNAVVHRYRISPDDQMRINTDTRLEFEVRNNFLVKANFILGCVQ